MSRYSRIRGPTVNFDLPSTLNDIPGMSIERYWDDGELLIIYDAEVSNQSSPGATTPAQIAVLLDDVAILGSGLTQHIAATLQAHLSKTIFHPITAGVHKIHLQAAGLVQAGDRILAGFCHLIIIQLPNWDSSDNLVDI